jgi:hypothetical protein
MSYSGPDRRNDPRVSGRFIVSYRILEDNDCLDISQTKNVSLGGMLLTTNRFFNPDTVLSLEIRLPFDVNPIKIIGKVIQSHEVTKDLIYDTRLVFLSIDEKHKKVITQTVDYYLKKK